MSQKWRPGSAGEKEEKQDRIMLICLGIITLLAWMCFAVFDTDMHAMFKRASTFDNIGGSLVAIGGWAWLWFMTKNPIDGKRAFWWIFCLAMGLIWSAGFNFDYFGL